MADLTDILQSQMSGQVLESLLSNMNVNNKGAAQEATSGAMTILLNALARNASKPGGASALGAALERDHDGSILDSLPDILSGRSKPSNTKTLDGAGILEHILGKKKEGAAEMLSKKSGLNTAQTLKLLMTIAPIVMGVLGKMKKTENVDPTGLPDILSGAAKQMNRKSANAGLIESFLDQDGDGNLNNEIKNVGFSFLKSLFGKRR